MRSKTRQIKIIQFIVVTVTLVCCFVKLANGVEKPKFELGLIGGFGYLPDYPAAAQSHYKGVVLPFPIYRGAFIRSDSKGLLRGRIINNRDFELDISLSGSLPSNSANNAARKGMPDLDYMAGFGPRLRWTIARAQRWAKLNLEFPIRTVFSTDLSSINHRGFVTQPEIVYQHTNILRAATNFKLGLSLSFADNKLNDYIYQIDSPFVKINRPLYSAKSGYIGSGLHISLSRKLYRRLKLFSKFGVNSHHGAANKDSPLFQKNTTYAGGFGVVWSLYQSSKMVTE